MNEHRRRRDVARIVNRRLTPQELVAFRLPRRAEKLALLGTGNVGSAVVTDPVADTSAGDRGREAIRLGNDPVGHESAIGVTGNAESLRIDRIMSKYVIDAGHHVLVVFDAPAPAPRRPQKVFAVASGAARIRVEYGIAIGGEQLQLEIEVVAVGAVRSAVDGKNERQSFTGSVCRDQHPTF